MGKGSTPRPLAVDDATYADRWARTFGPAVAEEPPEMECIHGVPLELECQKCAEEAGLDGGY